MSLSIESSSQPTSSPQPSHQQPADPLLFGSLGISKELGLLLGEYYWLCERTFGGELRAQLAAEDAAAEGVVTTNGEGVSTGAAVHSDEPSVEAAVPQQQAPPSFATPLPMVLATARHLAHCEGVSRPTAVSSITTKDGKGLTIVFRRDANGVPIMEL